MGTEPSPPPVSLQQRNLLPLFTNVVEVRFSDLRLYGQGVYLLLQVFLAGLHLLPYLLRGLLTFG